MPLVGFADTADEIGMTDFERGSFFMNPMGSLKYPWTLLRVSSESPMIHMTMKNAIMAVTKSA